MEKLRLVWVPHFESNVNIHEHFEIHTNDVLGQGQYGIVYSAIHKANSKEVALKVIDAANASLKQLSPETRIPKTLHHPGVIEIIGLFFTDEKIYIATDKLKIE